MRIVAAILFLGLLLAGCPELKAQKKPAAKPKTKSESQANPDGASVIRMLTKVWYAVYYNEDKQSKGDSIAFGSEEFMMLSISSPNVFVINIMEAPLAGKWTYDHPTRTLTLDMDSRLVDERDMNEIKIVISSITENKLHCTMMMASDNKEDAVEVVFVAYKPQ